MHKISIIVPVYNAEKYIDRCIKSIIEQTYQNWELLLINDGSTDRSRLICDSYAANDERIKLISKPNGGVSSARNLGLTIAAGEWVMFLDADDWVSPDCLEISLNEVMRNGLDALQFNHTLAYIDGHTEVKSKGSTQVLPPDQYLCSETFNVCVGGGLYRRNIIECAGIEFSPTLKLAEDQIFVLNFIKNSQRLMYLDSPMYFYFQHEASTVHNQKSNDLISACHALISLAENWSPAKQFVDSMCLVFLMEIIKKRDVSCDEVSQIYKKCSPKSMSVSLPKSTKVFAKLALISPSLACCALSFYFRIRS